MNPRIVEVRQNILKKNDVLARTLRQRFDAAGTFVVSLVSSPGAGKIDAEMIEPALDIIGPLPFEFLLIENVGNLVCPASYDLGEHMRVVLVSVTEGEDKPLKYPSIFKTSDLTVITKTDLAAPVGFDLEALLRNIEQVRPGLPLLETSARTKAGVDAWIGLLESRATSRARSRPAIEAPGW
jgi:hydrogenase nickel incorporation protein HypB